MNSGENERRIAFDKYFALASAHSQLTNNPLDEIILDDFTSRVKQGPLDTSVKYETLYGILSYNPITQKARSPFNSEEIPLELRLGNVLQLMIQNPNKKFLPYQLANPLMPEEAIDSVRNENIGKGRIFALRRSLGHTREKQLIYTIGNAYSLTANEPRYLV